MTYSKSVVPAETRRAVKERAAGACERCGARGESWTGARAFLSVHHTVPEVAGGDHSLGNLEMLCKTCHDAAHAKGAEASLSAYKTGCPTLALRRAEGLGAAWRRLEEGKGTP